MPSITKSIKSNFNSLMRRTGKAMDEYHNTFGVGIVAGYGLIGTGVYSAVVSYMALTAHIGSNLAGLMGFIAMGGTMMAGGAYVVAPLLATTFAVEAGVKMHKKRKLAKQNAPKAKAKVAAI